MIAPNWAELSGYVQLAFLCDPFIWLGGTLDSILQIAPVCRQQFNDLKVSDSLNSTEATQSVRRVMNALPDLVLVRGHRCLPCSRGCRSSLTFNAACRH